MTSKTVSIPREVAVENLRSEEIEHITQTVFARSEFLTADLLFIFGTSSIDSEILESVARDCLQGRFSKVLVTGLSGRLYHETGRPLALIMHDEAHSTRRSIGHNSRIRHKSTNTL